MPLDITDTQDKSLLFRNDYIAADFDTDKLSEEYIEFDLPFGKAKMKQWYFTGIRMAHSQWSYSGAAETEWKGILEVVTMYFNLSGKCSIQIPGLDSPVNFENQQRNIFYSSSANAIMKSEDPMTLIFVVQFTRDAFLSLAKDSNAILMEFAKKVNEKKPAKLLKNSLPIDIETDLIIRAILDCDYPSELKKMFLLSKTIELLVMQAKAFAGAAKNKDVFIKNEYDKQRITFVKEVLLRNMQSPPKFAQLATIAGINEFKLKKGFKEMFGVSVFGYLSEVRLQSAKIQLATREKTVTEIAFELGYSSVQHFSTAFKKKFGTSPGKR